MCSIALSILSFRQRTEYHGTSVFFLLFIHFTAVAFWMWQLKAEIGGAREKQIHPMGPSAVREMTKDAEAATLTKDPKENSEHVMLVDLAGNDLSRNGSNVAEKNKRSSFIPCYSLGFKVSCSMKAEAKLPGSGRHFPSWYWWCAKTQSTSTHRPLWNHTASRYGGAIGYMDFQGNFNHYCHSFLFKQNQACTIKLVQAL